MKYETYSTKPDHSNHELVITYKGLERRIDFKLECKETIESLVNEMKAELREEKIKKLLNGR